MSVRKSKTRYTVTRKLTMSTTEFESILLRLCEGTYPADKLGKILHRNPRTVRRWRQNPVMIPPEAIILLRAVSREKLSLHDVESLTKYLFGT